MRDCVAIFICHCETPLRRCGNLNIFKDLRDCFGRCTPSQRHCDTVSCAGQASGVYVHMLRKPTTPQACEAVPQSSFVIAVNRSPEQSVWGTTVRVAIFILSKTYGIASVVSLPRKGITTQSHSLGKFQSVPR